ncbi:MAG: ATP-binding protein, partial [Bacillales bacterium]|nr:ATP-binding protein [Bacillales bacterium]
MKEVKEFKTESKRLLDLMINSIYTNQEIFLRELISNASDAIDKYHHLSLKDETLPKRNDYEIWLKPNKEARTLIIQDNGIGLTYDEIEKNLGTIANSGSLEFLKKVQENPGNIDIIGQFGVGFYSLFMVSKSVEVTTKSPFSKTGYIFSSNGDGTYSIEECSKSDVGTEIKLFLKDNTEEENYDSYLETYQITSLVKKYSDYIRYPIKMLVKHSKPDYDDKGEPIKDSYKDIEEVETLNSMIPLWRKNKNEVSKDDLNGFYKSKYYDYQDPTLASFISVEGFISYNSL